jgi:hypothetical protein
MCKSSRRMASTTVRSSLSPPKTRRNWLKERATPKKTYREKRETLRTSPFGRTASQVSQSGPLLGERVDLDGILSAPLWPIRCWATRSISQLEEKTLSSLIMITQ